jgi:hypothetical protein
MPTILMLLLLPSLGLRKVNTLFQINDYCLVRRDRIGRKGGGVCLYVKSNLKVEQINLVSHNSHKFEMIWHRVTVSNSVNRDVLSVGIGCPK